MNLVDIAICDHKAASDSNSTHTDSALDSWLREFLVFLVCLLPCLSVFHWQRQGVESGSPVFNLLVSSSTTSTSSPHQTVLLSCLVNCSAYYHCIFLMKLSGVFTFFEFLLVLDFRCLTVSSGWPTRPPSSSLPLSLPTHTPLGLAPRSPLLFLSSHPYTECSLKTLNLHFTCQKIMCHYVILCLTTA